MIRLLLFLTFIIIIIGGIVLSTDAAAVKGGYYPSWLSDTFPPISINFSYFTHVFYAFVQLNSWTNELNVKLHDETIISALSVAAHSTNPPVKALLSIGGSSANTSSFQCMISSPSSRSAFINSSITVARRLNMDGLDISWNFPATVEDMKHLGELLTEWRQAIELESFQSKQSSLLLTAAVNYASYIYNENSELISYPVKVMKSSLDWINIVCYDYHRADNEPLKTGAHSAFFDKLSNISTSYGLSSWEIKGMSKEKLVMGIPIYGRSWKLKNPIDEHGIGASADGPASDTDSNGEMNYEDILELNGMNGTVGVYDESTISSYSYKDTTWVSYDDIYSIKYKIMLAKEAEIGGYFFWALGYGDKDWALSRAAWSAWQE